MKETSLTLVPNYSKIANRQIRLNRAVNQINHLAFLADRKWVVKNNWYGTKN